MLIKKNLRRALASFLISGSLFLMPVASAEIYTGEGEYTMSKYETPAVAEERAKNIALRYAQEQAGVYIESYSRAKNFDLLEDEIITIASNVLKLIEKPDINRSFLEDGSIKILVNIKVEIDTTKFDEYLKQNLDRRMQINSQMAELIKSNEEQAREIAELKKKLANITNPQDEQKITEQFVTVDNLFLSNQKYEEAQKLNDAGNYQESLKLSNEAIELNPNNSLAYYNRGSVYVRTKNYNSAIEDFTKAIELNPNYSVSYNDRGEAYRHLKQYDKAVADYNKAIELSPQYPFPYNNRAIVWDDLKQYDKALADYSKAIEISPNDGLYYRNRAYTYDNMKNYDAAIVDLNKALKLNKNDINAYNNRGWAYYNLKKYDKAISDYTKAIELSPNEVRYYNNRGLCYQALGQTEKATADFTKAKQLQN